MGDRFRSKLKSAALALFEVRRRHGASIHTYASLHRPPYLWSTNVTSIGFLSVRGAAGPQSRHEQWRSKVCHGTMHGRLTIPSPTRTLASKNRLSYHARGHLSPPQIGQSVDWTSFDGHVWEGEGEGKVQVPTQGCRGHNGRSGTRKF